MKTSSFARMAICVAIACAVLPVLSACGNKEEKPPAGYYDGPRSPKGVSNDTNPAPAGTTGSANTGTNP